MQVCAGSRKGKKKNTKTLGNTLLWIQLRSSSRTSVHQVRAKCTVCWHFSHMGHTKVKVHFSAPNRKYVHLHKPCPVMGNTGQHWLCALIMSQEQICEFKISKAVFLHWIVYKFALSSYNLNYLLWMLSKLHLRIWASPSWCWCPDWTDASQRSARSALGYSSASRSASTCYSTHNIHYTWKPWRARGGNDSNCVVKPDSSIIQ